MGELISCTESFFSSSKYFEDTSAPKKGQQGAGMFLFITADLGVVLGF
jgi:hypothetical protein